VKILPVRSRQAGAPLAARSRRTLVDLILSMGNGLLDLHRVRMVVVVVWQVVNHSILAAEVSLILVGAPLELSDTVRLLH